MQNNWLKLNDKVYIVTGGASGIGKSICKALLKNGAKVIACDIHNIDFECDFFKCDISDKMQVKKLVLYTTEKYGKIDGVVNNAGINKPRLLVDINKEDSPFEISEDDFNLLVNVNIKGLLFLSQSVARECIKNGEKGVIINLSSEAGKEGSAGQSLYSATKGAVDSFTRSWAKELGAYNIRVIAVAPGILEETGLRTKEYNEALAYTRGTKVCNLGSDYSKVIPLKRDGKLTEVSDLVIYLLSERASYLTGTTINISGGKSRG